MKVLQKRRASWAQTRHNSQKATRNAERGNVLFYVLIAVALIAALSYAVSSTSQGGGSADISQERAALAASEILEYANIITSATTQLKLRGCRDTEISFANPVSATDYSNANAPGDNTCDVFHVAGGGVQYTDPVTAWLDTAYNDPAEYEYYGRNVFTADACIDGVGTGGASGCNAVGSTATELLFSIGYLKENICIAINNAIGYGTRDAPPPSIATGVSLEDAAPYSGFFNNPARLTTTDNSLNGQRTACVEMDDAMVFLKVLIAR